MTLALRDAGPADAEAVAALHAASWRAAYRGILSDDYLDGPIGSERLALWRGRLAEPGPGQMVVLAEAGSELAGFACCSLDHDPRWGTLVDNLHAAPERRGQGIGRALLREVARRLSAAAPGRPVHLWCIDDNRPAAAFYARVGGVPAGGELKSRPGGTVNAVTRFTWPTPEALAAGAA